MTAPANANAPLAALVAAVPQEFERGVKLSTLKEWPGNPKTHDVDAIVSLMKANGTYGVVYVQRSSRRLIAGHGRKKAYRKLRVRAVDVVWLDVDDATAARIVAADNRAAELGGFDDAALVQFLEQFDTLEGTGYIDDDLEALRASIADDDAPASSDAADDETPPVSDVRLLEPPKKPISKRGEIYELGRHRLMCGDSRQSADVDRLLAGVTLDALAMDPPYCSGGHQETGKAAGSVGTRGNEQVENDILSTRGYRELMTAVYDAWPAGVVHCFTDWRMWINLFDVTEAAGYGVRNMIVWDKMTPGMGAGWRMQHELILCGVKTRTPFAPKHAQGNVIRARRSGNIWHPTQKPVDVLAVVMRVATKALVIGDPFGGSGTSILAGEQTGRTVYAMEKKPGFVDVTRQRYADLVRDPAFSPRGELSPADE